MPGSFLAAKQGVTREHMIAYVNLIRFSRKCCFLTPIILLLWITLLFLVSLRAHTEASFGVREAMMEHFLNLTAEASKGVAPNLVVNEGTEDSTSCRCACALSSAALCEPAPSVNNARFNSTIALQKLQLLRARAAYFGVDPSGNASAPPLQWGQLRTIPDAWFWIQHGLVPDIWHEEGKAVPVNVARTLPSAQLRGVAPAVSAAPWGASSGDPPGLMLRWSQIIGGIRMRQTRLQEKECRVDGTIAERYKLKCYRETSVSPFGPGTKGQADGFLADGPEHGAYDVYLDVGLPVHQVLETIEYLLKVNGWLDGATESLRLQAALLNAEAQPPLFGLLELRLDFERSGNLRKTISFHTASADAYPSALYAILDLGWAVLVLILLAKQIAKVVQFYVFNKGNPDKRIFFNVWNLLDWVTAVVSMALILMFALLSVDTESIVDEVAALPPAPPFSASAGETQRYHAQWGNVLDNVDSLVQWRIYYRLGLFWYTIVLTFQFFKALRGQPKIAQLASVVTHAAEDLVHFLLMFLVLFLSFAFSGFMIYGLALEGWSTPARALIAAFRALMGGMDLAEMYTIAPATTVVWYFLFVATMICVMLNLLLAIAYDHHQIQKRRAGTHVGVFSQLGYLLRDQRNRVAALNIVQRLSCIWCCRSDESIPKHGWMLEEMLRRAELSREERASHIDAVLGPQCSRNERHRSVFAGQGSRVSGAATMKSLAMMDLYRMGVDKEYVGGMLEECELHAEHEYDPEDTQVAQLRELVTMAEFEIATMRDRLLECHDQARGTMRDFSKRLESLECLVHSSLGEVVAIANDAGVPSSKEARAPADRKKLNSTLNGLRSLNPQQRRQGRVTASVGGMLNHLAKGQTPAQQKPATTQEWHRAMRRVDVQGRRTVSSTHEKTFYDTR